MHIYSQIENDNTAGAAAVATVLLVVSLARARSRIGLIQRWAASWPRVTRVTKWVPALRSSLFYLAFLLVIPVGLVFWRTFENGFGPFWDSLTHAGRAARLQGHAPASPSSPWSSTRSSAWSSSLLLVRHEFPGKRVLNLLIDLPLACRRWSSASR